MYNTQKTIYGIRVVPYRDENDVIFGKFEGIVISCSLSDFNNIEISKMVKKENGYFTTAFIKVPYEEIFEHSRTSGKAKADFLIKKAKSFAKENEDIAICDTLVPHLELMDISYKKIQNHIKKTN